MSYGTEWSPVSITSRCLKNKSLGSLLRVWPKHSFGSPLLEFKVHVERVLGADSEDPPDRAQEAWYMGFVPSADLSCHGRSAIRVSLHALRKDVDEMQNRIGSRALLRYQSGSER